MVRALFVWLETAGMAARSIMRLFCRRALVFICLVSAATAWASEPIFADEFWLCDNASKTPADSIAACTRILSNKPAGANLAMVWNNRGVGWFINGGVDSAIQDFTEAINTNPKLTVAYRNRAAAWLVKHQPDRAIHDLTSIIRLHPNDAVAYIDRGNALFQKGEVDRAIVDADKAISLEPKSVLAYLTRALFLQSKGSFESAIKDVNEAIRLAPRAADAYSARATIFLDKQDFARAVSDYSHAIDIDPGNWRLHIAKAEALRQKGDLPLAMEEYDRALAQSPDAVEIYNGRGILWRDRGDYKKAILDFSEAILRNSSYSHSYINRGEIWYLKGDIASALADFNKSLAIGPNAIAFSYRGRAWLALDDKEKAFADFREALRMSPNDISALEGRGEAYEQSGDLDSARADYERALSINPDKNPPSDLPAQARARARLAALNARDGDQEKAQYQTHESGQQEPARIALLIGNQSYEPSVGPLKNPHNDIALVKSALLRVGFAEANITIVRDAGRVAMLEAIETFAGRVDAAGPGAISFFYYSGHGAANDRRDNFLIPVDVSELHATGFWHRSVGLRDLLDKLSADAPDAKHFVIFDACRNTLKLTDAAAKALSQPKGFQPLREIPGGMLIAFATAEGELASDRGSAAGPYAMALADEIVKPGVEAITVFRNVQLRVSESIGQKPWTQNSPMAAVYFAGAQPLQGEGARVWAEIKSSKDIAIFEAYRRRYGLKNAVFDTLAAAKIEELKRSKGVSSEGPASPWTLSTELASQIWTSR
jgi:tetratricopeptide (TPR) repeat protein